MTRLSIDWDGEGAYAVITRPGQEAERVPLTHRDAVRLMSEAAEVVLVEEGRRAARYNPSGSDYTEGEAPHFIGALGE